MIRSGAFVPGLRSQADNHDLWIGPYTTVQGGIQHAGRVILGRGAVTWTHVQGGAEVTIGAGCRIPGNVRATGRIVVQAGARIDGTLRAGTDVLLLGDCMVGDVDASGDITVVGAPKTGELRPQGRVRTRPW